MASKADINPRLIKDHFVWLLKLAGLKNKNSYLSDINETGTWISVLDIEYTAKMLCYLNDINLKVNNSVLNLTELQTMIKNITGEFNASPNAWKDVSKPPKGIDGTGKELKAAVRSWKELTRAGGS